MKAPSTLALLLMQLLTSTSTLAQDDYYNRLYYACKAWGHAKYYHTEIANGSVNWDDELLEVLDDIKNAEDDAAFNAALLAMLNAPGEMGTSSASIPEIPDSLNNNADYTWIQDPIFTASTKEILETIQDRFRPRSHALVDQAFEDGNPTFDADNRYSTGTEYPNEKTRILALFRYWNIINYFFPYKDIMDQDWDATLIEFIPQIVKAEDALSYHLAFRQLTAKVDDSHSFFSSVTWWEWQGTNAPPFEARFIENEMVITNVLPGVTVVNPGDVIKIIDGIDIYYQRDSLRNYAYGSNEDYIEGEINRLILYGPEGDFSVTVDDGTSEKTVTLSRNADNLSLLNTESGPIWRETTNNDGCSFGIVDMGRLEFEEIEEMFNDLWFTDAIIFDIRNYPNGTMWEIINYLYPSSIHIANFTVPDITYPGRLFWKDAIIGTGRSNTYAGQVIMLFDERTQSQAEYTVMGLEQAPDAIKIGSTTAASDGNISKITLPGNINTWATFLGTFYNDYTPTQRVGIIPDYEVRPTIAGVRAGEDEVLNFAMNCDILRARNVVSGTDPLKEILLYPNPVDNEIRYTLVNDESATIELYDMKGEKLKSVNAQTSGSIDVSGLPDGIYMAKVISGEKSRTSKLIVKH